VEKMPKVKTHSSTKKRFKVVGNGSKVKRAKAGRRHLLTGKSRKRKRNLRAIGYVDSTNLHRFKVLLPYA
jgi:large subunit ribosomal protein L35